MTPRRTASERLYRTLVRLYPAAFRQAYGDDLVEAFATRYRTRSTGLFGFWTFHRVT